MNNTKDRKTTHKSRVFTIYTKKAEITDGKSNGLRHFEWETSQKISCDLRGCNFSTLFGLLS